MILLFEFSHCYYYFLPRYHYHIASMAQSYSLLLHEH